MTAPALAASTARIGDTRHALDQRDLDAIVEKASADLLAWRGARLLITGATGFVGSWLLRALVEANHQLLLDLELVALARRPGALASEVAASASVTPVAADIRNLDARDRSRIGHPDAVVHLACPSGAAAGSIDHDPRQRSATIIDGSRAVLRLAAASGRVRMLFASSGAVYGRGAGRPARIPEDCPAAPLPGEPNAGYGLAKRLMEHEAYLATAAGEADVVVARLWAFLGPLLPLDIHYAAGNFVADVLGGRPVHVKGNPATVRSYLYPTDLIGWLLAALTRGRPGVAYNIGSDVDTTIGELATTVAAMAGGRAGNTAGIRVSNGASEYPVDRYVPDTNRARTELGVRQTVDLTDAIARTLSWHSTPRIGDRS